MIKVGWMRLMRWKMTLGLVCDKIMPLRLKKRCYKAIVRLAMLYGMKHWQCWATTRERPHKLSVTRICMLRWMCRKTRKDKIKNQRIMRYLRMTPLNDKIIEKLLTCMIMLWRDYSLPIRRSLSLLLSAGVDIRTYLWKLGLKKQGQPLESQNDLWPLGRPHWMERYDSCSQSHQHQESTMMMIIIMMMPISLHI